MRKLTPYLFRVGLCLLGLFLIPLTGCSSLMPGGQLQATAVAPVYTGQLRTDHADALAVTEQLALGLLRLEDTADAVTAEQAAQLLPWWTAVQGATLTTEAERLAVVRHIEDRLTAAQLAAIQGMQLTQADAQAWSQAQGAPGPGQGGLAPGSAAPAGGEASSGRGGGAGGGLGAGMSAADREARRAQFESLSAEERAAMQTQFAERRGGAATGASGLLLRAVVRLLTERSGPPAAAPATPAATIAALSPTATPTAASAAAPLPRVTLAPLHTATPAPTTLITPTASPPKSAAPQPIAGTLAATPAAVVTPGALTQLPDTDPGPPLVVEVTTNYAEANPNLEGGVIYHVAGFVRNPTPDAYVVTAVHVTFFDASGFRGAFYAFPTRPGQRGGGGEWIAHGALAAEIVCPLLGPGEACPFTAEIAAQDMASFLVHPDAEIAEWREPVAVTLSDIKAADTGAGYVRLTGAATNPHPYAIKNVTFAGMLLDANGQMVSLGNGLVTRIEAGAAAPFEVYVPKEAYASFQVTARAEQVAQ